MNTRKIQYTGNSTYTVSLPKEWVSSMHLKRGDSVNLSSGEHGVLLISPMSARREEERVKNIQLRGQTVSHLERLLIGSYISGYNTITVRGRGKIENQFKEAIRRFSRSVTGVEIVEETIDSVVMKDLSNTFELSQSAAVRRLHLIVRSMQLDIMQALGNGDFSLAEDVINRDTDADRIYWIIMKEFNMMLRDPMVGEKMNISIQESSALFQIARYLERIGDHAVQMARAILFLKEEEIPQELLLKLRKAHQYAVSMVDDAVNAFFRRDDVSANDIIDRRDRLKEFIYEISPSIRKAEGSSAMYFTLIEESIRRTGYYATDICEVVLNFASMEG